MVATININGVIGVDTTLMSVIRQVKSFENVSEVTAIIDSVGGSVTQGQDIYSYLRNLEVPITTIAKKAYSISATIFMAGDVRLVERNDKPLMVHFPLVQNLTANSSMLDIVSTELKVLEKEFTEFYGNYLSIPKETIVSLLKAETFIEAEDAVAMGFATGIKEQLKAVAFFDKEDNKDNNLNKTFKMKLEKLMSAVAAKLGVNESEVEVKTDIVALVVQDANGKEINFPDLKEEEAIEVGVKAEIDGQPAEGEIVNTKGDTWLFSEGVLTEVIPKKEEAPEAPEEFDVDAFLDMIMGKVTAKMEKENGELKAELVAVKQLLGQDEPETKSTETKSTNKKRNLAQVFGNKRK